VNVRPFVDADAAAVADLIALDDERFYPGRPGRVTGADVLMFQQWSNEAWVWEEDGRVVASATFRVHAGTADVRGIVGERGRGIGADILERGEAFARAAGAEKILAGAAEPNADARTLFERRGYREVRRFYEMAIELTEEPPVAVLPDGLVVDEIRDGEQRAFYDALNEAFAEHWQWHPTPFEEWSEIRNDQHHDESGPLWFVVRDGDELAAVIRNEAQVAGAGYVGAIGVRPGWRGKGLGKALLQRAFAEFWRRGTRRVTLDVDAQNETGATQLYQRVGMHVDACGVAFEKELA
jgi:mycothiol synthase